MVELVPGYGVVLSQRQIDEAIDNSNNSPTRLIRHLMSAFFTKEVLSTSSALGGRKNNALDKDIVAACLSELLLTWSQNSFNYAQKYIGFVQSKYTVAKTVLIDAINDKCANARRTRNREEK